MATYNKLSQRPKTNHLDKKKTTQYTHMHVYIKCL